MFKGTRIHVPFVEYNADSWIAEQRGAELAVRVWSTSRL